MPETDSTPVSNVEILAQIVNEHARAGAAFNLQVYLDRYPHLAQEIREMIEAQRNLDQARPAIQPDIPARLGDYRLVREVARGGMGEVYEAVQESLGRRVAVKIIRRGHVSPQAKQRFLREQTVLARLHQTHIVPIHAAGEEGALQYFVMPFIDGTALNHVVRTAWQLETPGGHSKTPELKRLVEIASGQEKEGRPPATADIPSTGFATTQARAPAAPAGVAPQEMGPRTILTLSTEYYRSVAKAIADVAEALQHAHDARILHRDMKPSNIMVDKAGQCWIIDFGLAGYVNGQRSSEPAKEKQTPAAEPLTAGDMLGTPQYMAPEQFQGKADARSDVRGLGVTLYELLTLRRAFDGATYKEIQTKVEAHQMVPPEKLVRKLPGDLRAICRKALGKEPDKRYKTAREVAEDLRRWLRWEPTTARRGILRRLFLWACRNPGWAIASLMAVVLMILTMALITINADQEIAKVKVEQEIAKANALALQEKKRTLLEKIRFTAHVNGWSKTAWELAGEGVNLEKGDQWRDPAAATLGGIDAPSPKVFKETASDLAFDSKGVRLLFGGTPNKPARLWDSGTGKEKVSENLGEGPVVFDKDDNPLQLAVQPDRSLQLWNVEKSQKIATFTLPLPAGKQRSDDWNFNLLDLSAKGEFVAAFARHQTGMGLLAVWETASGKVRLQKEGNASALAFGRSGPWLAVAGDMETTIWSLTSGEKIKSLKTGRRVIKCLAFGRNPGQLSAAGANSELLAVGENGGFVTVWELAREIPISFCRGSNYQVLALAFSPDGATLASAGRDTAKLWDVATGRVLLDLGNRNAMTGIAFAPDGRRLGVIHQPVFGDRGGVDVWTLELGRGLHNMRGLAGQIAQVRYSLDGKYIAALAHNWQVGIWDAASGRLEHILDVPQGFSADNAAFAFNRDAKKFAFAAGQEAKLWDLVTGKEEQRWTLPPGLSDFLGFNGGQLLLFRVETKDHARVCRIRDLLSPNPLTPVKEITDFNWHVLRGSASADASSIVVQGVGGPDKRRFTTAFEGPTGKVLWTKPFPPNKTGDDFTLWFDPAGKVMTMTSALNPNGVLVDMPSGKDFKFQAPAVDKIRCLGPDAKFWGAAANGPPYGFRLYRREDKEPVVVLGIDTPTHCVHAEFNPAGTHAAWGNDDGSVTVGHIEEVRRRLAELGLGW